MRLEHPTDEGTALEEDVAAYQQRVEFLGVQRLQVTAHLNQHITSVRLQRLDLSARAEVIVHAIDFAGTRTPAVEQHQLAQLGRQLGIELRQGFMERSFADAGGPAENYETTGARRIRHRQMAGG